MEQRVSQNITSTSALEKRHSHYTLQLRKCSQTLGGNKSIKAAGLDNLAGKFLKDDAPTLAKTVTELCNLSTSLSCFLYDCKNAKLKPLFKKGSKEEPKYYRLISPSPQIFKVIEKIVHEQTPEYSETNKIFHRYQSSFHPHYSTDTCLSYLSDNIIQGFENWMFTGMILIDLQKAFDTIDHDNFLRKMKHLAFSDSAIYWLRSYLTSRTFFVNIAKETSSPGDSTMWTSTRLYPWPTHFPLTCQRYASSC